MKTLTLIALSFISTAALAVPTGKKVETLLNAPGARELMDEEVQSWKHASEFSIRSAHNDVAVGGSVILRGTPSPAQRFNRGKLISCNVRLIGSGQFAASRNSCDMSHPVYLPLSLPGQDQPTSVAPGYYVLAFENSIYPGFLQVKAGELTAIDLRQIPIPAGGNVKVYRDLNALTEELKQYFSTYVLGGNVFSLAEYPFGDLYIKSFGMRDGSVPLNYNICAAATRPKMTTKGDRLCKAYNMGTFMMMMEMFSFASNGSYTQWEVGPQGKPYAYPLGRLLVAKQTTSAVASFVNVLPGQYVVEMTDAKGVVKAVPMNAGAPTSTSQMNVGWIPAGAQLKMNGDSSIAVPASIDPSADPNEPSADALASADDGGDDYVDTSMTCSSARQWRTDLRAYCTSDSTPGCARSSAKVCEPMFDTP